MIKKHPNLYFVVMRNEIVLNSDIFMHTFVICTIKFYNDLKSVCCFAVINILHSLRRENCFHEFCSLGQIYVFAS